MATDKKTKVSYAEKKPRNCPVCGKEFYHEKLLTGGGRLIAGKLRDDLRRTYEESKKYGRVYPLIYQIVVCPRCYYSSMDEDFSKTDKSRISQAQEEQEKRIEYVNTTFGDEVDFDEERSLKSGAASYMLAMAGYNYHGGETAPTFKKGLCALRAAWAFEDLTEEYPDENYKDLIPFFLAKAQKYYTATVDMMSSTEEALDKVKFFGPDTDKNFGFDGLIYMSVKLTAQTAYLIDDPVQRHNELLAAKRRTAKIFGTGKSSKSKPSEFLDFARDLYDEINDYIEELEQKHGIEPE